SYFQGFISRLFGVLLAASITLAQMKKQQIRDEEQKRERVIESLILEIKTHEELLQRPEIIVSEERAFATALPTSSYDGIIASGLYTLVPPETQIRVSYYYHGCHKIKNYIQAGLVTPPRN
ncbi:unnamed protein product, partial [marine sediment metagenome]